MITCQNYDPYDREYCTDEATREIPIEGSMEAGYYCQYHADALVGRVLICSTCNKPDGAYSSWISENHRNTCRLWAQGIDCMCHEALEFCNCTGCDISCFSCGANTSCELYAGDWPGKQPLCARCYEEVKVGWDEAEARFSE